MKSLRIVILLSAALLLAHSGPAAAQSPFGSGPSNLSQPAPTPDDSSNQNKPDDDSPSNGQIALILLVGALLLAGIAWAILRDSKAQVGNAEPTDTQKQSRAATEADRHRRKQQSRKKGQAAKHARRSNRPRR